MSHLLGPATVRIVLQGFDDYWRNDLGTDVIVETVNVVAGPQQDLLYHGKVNRILSPDDELRLSVEVCS